MTLRWQEPPPDRRLIFQPEIVEELRANPGRWALIRTWPHYKRSQTVKTPLGIETRFRYSVPDNTTELYARARVHS